MFFRTEIELPPNKWAISHQDRLFGIGSCFIEAMGRRLSENKFQISTPFATIFNPLSIFRLLRIAAQIEEVDEKLFIENQEGIAYHYDFHSSWRNRDIASLRAGIAEQLPAITDFLHKSQFVLITFGTAWVYELRDTHRVVANCHKMPATFFDKRLLSVEEIVQDFESLQSIFDTKQIILTVSPVRHLKDTLPLNAVSKSVLRLACHYLQEKYPNIYYFPAFELINDDLRDYRFYADDMLHIGSQGEEYIWNKFLKSCIRADSQEIISKWKKISASLKHQFFNTNTPAYQAFLEKVLKDLQAIATDIDVSEEITKISALIKPS